jgi:quercetin dioxygenase-like cupin family protein
MNIQQIHPEEKEVSALTFFKGEEGVTKSIHLSKGAELAKHQSKTPAILICITGETVFENEKGVKETLKQGDYIDIEPMVQHQLNSIEDSYLLLIK